MGTDLRRKARVKTRTGSVVAALFQQAASHTQRHSAASPGSASTGTSIWVCELCVLCTQPLWCLCTPGAGSLQRQFITACSCAHACTTTGQLETTRMRWSPRQVLCAGCRLCAQKEPALHREGGLCALADLVVWLTGVLLGLAQRACRLAASPADQHSRRWGVQWWVRPPCTRSAWADTGVYVQRPPPRCARHSPLYRRSSRGLGTSWRCWCHTAVGVSTWRSSCRTSTPTWRCTSRACAVTRQSHWKTTSSGGLLVWQDGLVNFDIVVLEQSPHFRFNRGALLNAGVLLLSGLDHDYYVFNDADTAPAKGSGLDYAFPEGSRPLHLTPPNLHPKYSYDVRSCPTLLLPMLSLMGFPEKPVQRRNFLAASPRSPASRSWRWTGTALTSGAGALKVCSCQTSVVHIVQRMSPTWKICSSLHVQGADDNLRERLARAGRWPPQRSAHQGVRDTTKVIHLSHEQQEHAVCRQLKLTGVACQHRTG